MDLNTFVITGPSTVTLSSGWEVGGNTVAAAGIVYTQATDCLTDQFTMTGVSGALPPVLCGTNSGYHCKQICALLFSAETNRIKNLC